MNKPASETLLVNAILVKVLRESAISSTAFFEHDSKFFHIYTCKVIDPRLLGMYHQTVCQDVFISSQSRILRALPNEILCHYANRNANP